jgi:hypothetical protein
MARGFESKAVADQQESAEAPVPEREAPAGNGKRAAQLKRLELARVDVVRRMETAAVPAHRELLQRTLAALDQEIANSR